MNGPAKTGECCPNCGQAHGPISACALGVLLGVVDDRGELDIDSITPEILAGIDADEFWGRFGAPAVEWLEEQLLALGAKAVAGG
jgi:hypothetical protein